MKNSISPVFMEQMSSGIKTETGQNRAGAVSAFLEIGLKILENKEKSQNFRNWNFDHLHSNTFIFFVQTSICVAQW